MAISFSEFPNWDVRCATATAGSIHVVLSGVFHEKKEQISVDPAISDVAIDPRFAPLSSLEIIEQAVYIFDFDGVISSSYEDDIYKLPPNSYEDLFLANAAKTFKLNCAGMELRYQRHLIYQTAAWFAGVPIAPGSGFQKARLAAEKSHLFILTARSGWYAIERARTFLLLNNLIPLEMFHVGRVAKVRQLELISKEFKDLPLYYIEDSAAHLSDAMDLSIDRLIPVIARSSGKRTEPGILRRDLYDLVETASAKISMAPYGDKI